MISIIFRFNKQVVAEKNNEVENILGEEKGEKLEE